MTLPPRIKIMKRITLLTFALQGGALAACDTAGDGDYKGEELFTVQGAIMGTPASTPTSAQAALVWGKPGADAAGHLLGESAAVESVFPANFSFDIFSPPDPSTIFLPSEFDDIGGMEFAMASILAFDDVNGDNTLSVSSDELGIDAPDTIIGVAENDYVLYVQKSPTEALEGIPDPTALVPGYYILHFPCPDRSCPIEIKGGDYAVEITLTTPSNRFPESFPFGGSSGEDDTGGGGDSEEPPLP